MTFEPTGSRFIARPSRFAYCELYQEETQKNRTRMYTAQIVCLIQDAHKRRQRTREPHLCIRHGSSDTNRPRKKTDDNKTSLMYVYVMDLSIQTVLRIRQDNKTSENLT